MSDTRSNSTNQDLAQINLARSAVDIWNIDLDGPCEDCLSQLAPDEIKRFEKTITETDRNRYLRSRFALRRILAGYLGTTPGEIIFDKGIHGKPYLVQPRNDLQFNLTHCEGKALLAICQDSQVGIDLELIRPRPSLVKIGNRMFSAHIMEELEAMSEDQLPTEFYKHWTELEAKAKCIGQGIFSCDREVSTAWHSHFTPEPGWIACLAVASKMEHEIQLKHF